MKVIDALANKQTLSFEFFPPKTTEQEEQLFKALAELKQWQPDYCSVTYGALGNSREKTFYWVEKIKSEYNIEPVAHMTCVAASKEDIAQQIKQLKKAKIENLLALRGDIPKDEQENNKLFAGFSHASQLVDFIKKNQPGFCLGVAGYPEGHPEAKDLSQDIIFLKEKINCGADYIVTQLFFENEKYFDFVQRCEEKNIDVPIIPGLILATSYKSIQKMTQMCNASLPDKLRQKLEKYKDDPVSIVKIGIDHAVEQVVGLKEKKVPGLHFFVLNQAGPISQVLKQL
jgi:methylenetetrahydrofolate reductase (NADPH)